MRAVWARLKKHLFNLLQYVEQCSDLIGTFRGGNTLPGNRYSNILRVLALGFVGCIFLLSRLFVTRREEVIWLSKEKQCS